MTRRHGLRGFALAGYGRFLATDTFATVLGKSEGLWWGGGGAYLFANGAFAQATVERFQRTGERVFVFEDEVFRLGLTNEVAVTPVMIALGYRTNRDSLTPYVATGIGRYFFRETSDFAEADENVRESFTSYQVLGGVEWRWHGLLGTAVEVQYAHVPGALKGGLATAFDEQNLGGFKVVGKLLVGR
jgi:hypothetical protein